MKILKASRAGSLESGDILIIVEEGEPSIEIESDVLSQFGRRINEVILNVVNDLDVKNARIKAIDKGALDFTIDARVRTALYRACDVNEYDWEA